jgi:thiol-disulfide isomerase/thioredoxin
MNLPTAPSSSRSPCRPVAASCRGHGNAGGRQTPWWQAAHLPPGIDWFTGDVNAAFAAARAANKPVFLYWGAEWCPPCAQIKTTIFSKREFQERSRLFVPVYLDGDTPSAQKYGERFGVVGYPTMILFKPDGTEITRLPGGVDVARYARILDVALADARPVSDILAAARSGGAVTSNDWRLLAYYPWGNGRLLPQDQQQATRTGASLPGQLPAECARFLFNGLARCPTRRNPASRLSTGSSAPMPAADCWHCCRRRRSRRRTSTTCCTAPGT